MESRRIASIQLGGLKPLGRAVERDHGQLSAWLAAHPEVLGDNRVIFAEPVPARDGGRVDWYIEEPGRSVELESLDEPRRTALLERATRALDAIRTEGETLAAARNPLGAALIAASQTPAPLARYVHVLLSEGGDTPIIVCWAYGDDAPRATGVVPQAMKPAPLPPRFEADRAAEFATAPAMSAETRRRFAWWGPLWLLLALLLLAIGWFLLRACGVAWPLGGEIGGYRYCRPAVATLAAEVERGRALDDAARQLELKLVQHRTACLANAPPPLPRDRWQGKDLAILAGCWTLGKDTQTLVVNENGKQEHCTVRAGTVCFGSDGTGTREQTTDCGTQRFSVCKAPIKARFTDAGALETEQPETKCEPATITWHSAPNRMTCKRVDDGGALCRDGDNFEHDFRKKTP